MLHKPQTLTVALFTLAIATVVLLSACAPKAATPQGASGKWSGSYLTRVYRTDFETVYFAAKDYLKSEGVTLEAMRDDPTNGLLVGYKEGTKYIYRIETYKNGLTEVSLKVHPVDQQEANAMLDALETMLPATAQPQS